MPKVGWIVDLTKCIGCHACYTACKAENRTSPRTDWRTVIMRESGTFPAVKREFISLACNHCDEPACLKSCPTGAITKRADGVVLIDQEKCNGCRYCAHVCPYGAPRIDTLTKKVSKCTMCVHRLDAGLQPACVETCLAGAITFVPDFQGTTTQAPEDFGWPVFTKPKINFVVP
jgi:Fe-S-cluster-containing dehydrogenase component